jgi:hypothetical protein
MEESQAPPTDYPSSQKTAAVLMTLVAPFLSIIAALVMMGSEQNPVRRASLKSWAWLSGSLLVIGFVIGLSLFVSFAGSVNGGGSSEGPCVGGPKMGEPLVQIGPNRYRQECAISGSTVVRLP